MRYPVRIGIVAVMLVTAITTALAPPTWADPGFVDGPPDGGQHNWCLSASVSQALIAPIQASMSYLDSASDVNGVPQHVPCRLSGGSQTDVVWKGSLLDPGDIGWTGCESWWSDLASCDRYGVYLDKNQIDYYALYPANEYRHTACHELGHSAGLSHYVNGDEPGGVKDCMMSGVWDGGQSWTRTYDPHHITSHLNAYF